jgi:predicted Zn finger-like uncharacterized protein
MILTCPQCATRYQVDGANFPAAGRSVRCAKCGHVWHQIGPEPEPDPDAEIVAHDSSAAIAPAVTSPAAADVSTPSAIRSMAPAAVTTEPEETPRTPRSVWVRRGVIAGGWLMLVALIIVVGWAAVVFRDAVAAWLPRTAAIYNAAGLPVNATGMDIADPSYTYQIESGQKVLVVSGKVINRGDHELAVPAVRIALFDGNKHELYHWNVAPSATTLSPGGLSEFHARLPNPPEATRSAEVTFAPAGE